MNHFNFTGCRIMVVGVLMLDKYLSGSVERLSPEAPVPVLLREAERAVWGGEANVCANLTALGAGPRGRGDRPRRSGVGSRRPPASLPEAGYGSSRHRR
jgi:bifunctional ADP-heptose synthase (sugar kinase/adenylyltransferase)